jgi:deaminated glutathione amidase
VSAGNSAPGTGQTSQTIGEQRTRSIINMPKMIRVAAVQMRSGPDVSENLSEAVTAIEQAANGGAQIIVFPEATMFWFGGRLIDVAEPMDGPFATRLQEEAARYRVTVVAGLFEPVGDGRVYNTLLLTGPDGTTTYRKVHLYDAFGARESDMVASGSEYVVFESFGTKIGLATCYDVRFADQFNYFGNQGAELIVISASWGDGPGKAEQWDLLIRARAMDSQAWIVACDQAWQEPRGTAPLGVGRSAIVDPTGVVHGRLSAAPDLLMMDIDLELVREVRARIPILGV